MSVSSKEYDGIHKYLRITDIDEKSRKFNKDKLTSPDIKFNSSSKKYLLSNNDIVFARTGASTGKTYMYQKEDGIVYYAGFLIKASLSSNFDNNFIFQQTYRKRYYQRVKVISQRSGQPGINSKEYGNFDFLITQIEEQNKIGKLFKIFDNLLALYERKLKLLSQVKKYFLDNLFAKKEYPNLRFKGYEDTWLKSKFSKFLSIPEKVKVTIDSPSRILTVKLNLGGVQKGANRTTLKLNSTTYYLRKAGQLIYGKQNLFNGSLAIIPSQFEGYVTSGDVPSLNINNIDKRFLYYYIARKSFYKKTEAYSSGTGSKRIHEKTFLGFNIVYPEDLKEQEKISKLISSINSNIELYRSKKNNLMAIKKNLLNAMFI